VYTSDAECAHSKCPYSDTMCRWVSSTKRCDCPSNEDGMCLSESPADLY
jgi:hypothetical protein